MGHGNFIKIFTADKGHSGAVLGNASPLLKVVEKWQNQPNGFAICYQKFILFGGHGLGRFMVILSLIIPNFSQHRAAIMVNFSVYSSSSKHLLNIKCTSIQSSHCLRLSTQVFFNNSATALKLPAVGVDRAGCGKWKNRKIKQEIKSWNLCKLREAAELRNSNSRALQL